MSSASKRREDIFRAASPVFLGSRILGNDRFAIKTRMSNCPKEFESVVKVYGIEMVVQIISSLIDNGRITTRFNARPELSKTHQPSEVRDRQHAALEEAVAQSEAKDLDEASRSDLHTYQSDQDEIRPIEDPSASTASNSPPLFPSYLSYISQHKLLNTVQRVLEDCCYEWVANWIPSLLAEQKWTCSEAVELCKCSIAIPRRFDSLDFNATSLDSEEALSAVFLATHPLRHAAVHRLAISVRGIEKMLENSLNLVTALKDPFRMGKLQDILKDFRSTMRAMEVHKNDLETSLDRELHLIQEQRAALDKKEREARLEMFQQDREHTAQISCLFESSIKKLTLMDEASMTKMEQEHLKTPEIGAAGGDSFASDNVIKHNAEEPHQTIDEANFGNTDSKSSNHSDHTAQAIPWNASSGDPQPATTDMGSEKADNRPGNTEDIAASTPDYTETPNHQSPSLAAELDLDQLKLASQPVGGEEPPTFWP